MMTATQLRNEASAVSCMKDKFRTKMDKQGTHS